MSPFLYIAEVQAGADRYGLDKRLVQAVCWQESGGNTEAFNPEQKWRYFWNVKTSQPFRPVTHEEMRDEFPPKDFPTLIGDPDQEWWLQQASIGLMQTMGSVAREQGCRHEYLLALCRPHVGIEFGCKVLASNLRWSKGDVRSALAAYNGGRKDNEPGKPLRNAAYAEDVVTILEGLRHA